MPIIRASEYKHSWIKKAVQDMKTNGSIAATYRRDYETQQLMRDKRVQTTKKDTQQNVSTSNDTKHRLDNEIAQDIKIRTIGNGEDVKFDVPFQSQGETIVQKHLTHAFYLSLKTGKNTMQKIIKIVYLAIEYLKGINYYKHTHFY